MKSSAKNIKLASVDDLFKTDEGRADDERERVQEIAISELHPFKDHPFKVLDDEKMMETVESVQQYGVLVPIIARPSPEGGYEIVSGHRRHRACELAGKETIPAIVRDLDDDEAVLLMVDSNLQRETILPSERAFAFKMKLEAMKHQGARNDLTSAQVGRKLDGKESREILAEQVGQSRNQVSRYIHLTELIPPLLNMVDEKKIAFNPAYELSFLKPEEQEMLIETMDYEQATPSLSQAQRLKQFSQEGHLTEDSMLAIMSEEKKPVQDKIMFTSDVLRKYFPKDYTPRKMEETIIKLLEQWKQRRLQQQDQQRRHNSR
ncbi:MAG: ParB/RepB/Spo0J family partition protein [Lachnospiraceae bacterium]|nr:ParB/RepB/Spo0J family partition protein [Lachnospiraceae bacterium]